MADQIPRPVLSPHEARSTLDALLLEAVRRGGTDVHVRAGDIMRSRVDGELVGIGAHIFSADDMIHFVERLREAAPGDVPPHDRLRDLTLTWSVPSVGRFRASVVKQRSTFMVLLRVIPHVVPSLESLHIPAELARALDYPSGLLLLSGTQGSGRSTTLAALLSHLNETSERRRHIVIIETKTRFLLKDRKCTITQRELGIDTDSVESALDAAIEHRTDIIALDRVDPHQLESLLRAAEAGSLVIAKVDAHDVTDTLRHLVSGVPTQNQSAIRLRIAKTVRGILAHKLVAANDGGRVLATELYLASPEFEQLLMDAGAFLDIRAQLARHRADVGTHTFDQSLAELALDGKIGPDVAISLSVNPADVRTQLRGGVTTRPGQQHA
ncbi:MAG: Flp pilus assembly complex ATPase component TadA [Gemmatimonadetes bacterium]|nr:Flp pilus assembly complex ATPase component TadA [Gemmatimonadota bacterium]